jgi:3-isopropylmalate/(R)-2-methylmalate dehydratase small subunit
LNRPEYRNASILVSGPNFGCGSSREHAPWALQDWGIQVIIAPSFADIFYSNCLKNGLLPVILPKGTVAEILRTCQLSQGLELTVDVKNRSVLFDDTRAVSFPLVAYYQESLLQGLDEIGRTLRLEASILRFEGQEVARINSRA